MVVQAEIQFNSTGSLILLVTVAPATAGGPTPTGTVGITLGFEPGGPVATQPLVGGVAQFTLVSFVQALLVSYSGDDVYQS